MTLNSDGAIAEKTIAGFSCVVHSGQRYEVSRLEQTDLKTDLCRFILPIASREFESISKPFWYSCTV